MAHGTIKLHFSTAKSAIAASADGSATAGVRSSAGKIKTWIAHVAKATPTETLAQASERLRITSKMST